MSENKKFLRRWAVLCGHPYIQSVEIRGVHGAYTEFANGALIPKIHMPIYDSEEEAKEAVIEGRLSNVNRARKALQDAEEEHSRVIQLFKSSKRSELCQPN